jgi:DNA-binding MarR family transcriptional regulator
MLRERTLAIVLAGLMLAMIPAALADGDSPRLDTSLYEAPEKGWFSSGDIVSISLAIINDGPSTVIDTDPSCGDVIRVWSGADLVFDGMKVCREQSRGLELAASSTLDRELLSWDLLDDEGMLVPSGEYVVETIVAGSGLSSSQSVDVQTPVLVPEGLELEATITTRTGVFSTDSPAVLTLNLVNNLDQEMTLDMNECRINIDDVLSEACGPSVLAPREVYHLTSSLVILEEGEQVISWALGDGALSDSTTISVAAGEGTGTSTGDLSALELRLQLTNENNGIFGGDEMLQATIEVVNVGVEDVTLDFTDTCRGEMWVVDSSGLLVMDTRLMKSCTSFELQNLIEPSSAQSFNQPEWAFTNLDGCNIGSGVLTLIAELPEHNLFGSQTIFLDRGHAENCGESPLSIEGDLSSFADSLLIDLKISATQPTDITWVTACGIETSLNGEDGEVAHILSNCDQASDITQRIDSPLSVEEIGIDMSGLDNGDYFLTIKTNSNPSAYQVIEFSWPLIEEESQSDETVTEDVTVETWVVSGTWNSISSDEGVCWFLSASDGDTITLAGAPGLISWIPANGVEGHYQVVAAQSTPACATFSTESIDITEVVSENTPVVDAEKQDTPEPAAEIAEEEDGLSPAIITIGAVVASTGILATLFGMVATNESWRIPVTTAGLWFMGLLGRTSETSDGRYQRGRLMGYLTANPGCHFRALMAALEMSNGQITHHLKVLENEEGIWRRPDGRLVRFYPFTSNLHPTISDEDLPLPPLSPDPNSLQGKILHLLDDDGQMNEFPTQAELAQRLDRSQQLVSHHLRTLQKFGLVEKRKMGVRNRYRLTREAMFLLETNEF